MSPLSAKIAILCWEEGLVPRGLVRLESLAGNSTNPATYPYPVTFRRIPGATTETVLKSPSREVLDSMILESKKLIAEGIAAITTSCGFNVIFQNELNDALDALVFTSSLLQVPFVRKITPSVKKIGIITADSSSLTEKHLAAAGISPEMGVEIFGLEKCPEWRRIFSEPESDIDPELISKEVLQTALSGLRQCPEIGAFVLECTDLPPFSAEIRRTTGLPVYDFTTLVSSVALSLGLVKSF